MIFHEMKLQGAYIMDPERVEDERGFFARTWCQRELEAQGLNPNLAQCSISFNRKKGTLRGMHHQDPPYQEAKIVRCTMGAIYDVIVDLRTKSPTFKQHFGVLLTADSRRMLYVPEGFSHGFLTMADNTEVFYQISEFYTPDYARGIRWNDPEIGIQWPGDVVVISEKDRNYPDFKA